MHSSRSFSHSECPIPCSNIHSQSTGDGSGHDPELPANNRVCVVDMSHDNSHNPESSFHWETDQSGMSSRYSIYPSAELDVSPIPADGTGHMAWLTSMVDGNVQTRDTLERLNVRARPNPVVPQNAGAANGLCSTHPSEVVGVPKPNNASELQERGSHHQGQSSGSSSGSSSARQALPFRSNSPTTVISSRDKSKYSESSYQQVSDVSAISGASMSSTSETSSSSFNITPVPTSNTSKQSSRPLPRPPCPSRPVPQPTAPNQSRVLITECPPVPDRQPIVSRRLPKTPKNPLAIRQKVPRPKSTPPFKELHKNIQDTEDDQSGYESEPSSAVDITENKSSLGDGRLPEYMRSKHVTGAAHRFSEGYPVHRKIVKLSEDTTKKSGSFRHSTDKPFRRQPLSSSHESLVINKDELNGTTNSRLHAATSVTTITSKGLVITSHHTTGNIQTVGRAASWAVSFDKLLQDKVGITIFTEFLKKEFSEENIIFWKACQEYKNITDVEQRKRLAKQLFDKHLSMDASEPVNIDSSCRQEVRQMLDNAPQNTFTVAQLQITQLMKQDSYVRFLKSDSYKACVMAEMEGKPLPCPQTPSSGDTNNNRSSPAPPTPSDRWRKTLKKSKSSTSATDDGGGEEKKRRSLLPWGKNKSDKKLAKMSTDPDLRRNSHDSSKGRPSLDLADLNTIGKHLQGTLQEIDPKNVTAQESHKFCRVILPDSSTTVIVASTGRTIQAALCELCQRRQLILELLLVCLAGDDNPLDMSRDLCSLASRQIILDKLCVFRLDLPQKRYVCVRAKPSQTVASVFKPILEKYGLALDQNTVVHVAGTGVILKEDQSVSVLEHKQVIVQSLDDFKEWGSYGSHRHLSSKPPVPRPRSDVYKQANKLEELMAHLFRDVLDTTANNLDPNNIKFDETGSWDVSKFKSEENRSSGILGFIRRNSVGEREGNKAKVKPGRVSLPAHQSKPQGVTTVQPPQLAPAPPIRGGGKRFDADDERLFELLSRAQSRQLDDQRGLTARDLELPDFLRLKEEKKPEQPRSVLEPAASSTSAVSVQSSHVHSIGKTSKFDAQRAALSEGIMTPRTAKFAMGNCSFSSDGVIPTPNHGTTYFMDGLQNMEESQLMDPSLCDLGMTSDMQNRDQSYMSYMLGSKSEDLSLGCRPLRVSQVSGVLQQPQVPKRRNPPSSKTHDGTIFSQSKNGTPAASDDDLDITLIPPSDSSGDEAAPLPSPPHLDQSVVNHPEEANYSPPIPLNITGKERTQTNKQSVRTLSKHLTYSKMIPSQPNHSVTSSSSGCDSDIELELMGPPGAEHRSQSTPSPTTHDLVFDSGSECSTSLMPSSRSSLSSGQDTKESQWMSSLSSSTRSSSSQSQSRARNSRIETEDNVPVSFV